MAFQHVHNQGKASHTDLFQVKDFTPAWGYAPPAARRAGARWTGVVVERPSKNVTVRGSRDDKLQQSHHGATFSFSNTGGSRAFLRLQATMWPAPNIVDLRKAVEASLGTGRAGSHQMQSKTEHSGNGALDPSRHIGLIVWGIFNFSGIWEAGKKIRSGLGLILKINRNWNNVQKYVFTFVY